MRTIFLFVVSSLFLSCTAIKCYIGGIDIERIKDFDLAVSEKASVSKGLVLQDCQNSIDKFRFARVYRKNFKTAWKILYEDK